MNWWPKFHKGSVHWVHKSFAFTIVQIGKKEWVVTIDGEECRASHPVDLMVKAQEYLYRIGKGPVNEN